MRGGLSALASGCLGYAPAPALNEFRWARVSALNFAVHPAFAWVQGFITPGSGRTASWASHINFFTADAEDGRGKLDQDEKSTGKRNTCTLGSRRVVPCTLRVLCGECLSSLTPRPLATSTYRKSEGPLQQARKPSLYRVALILRLLGP